MQLNVLKAPELRFVGIVGHSTGLFADLQNGQEAEMKINRAIRHKLIAGADGHVI